MPSPGIFIAYGSQDLTVVQVLNNSSPAPNLPRSTLKSSQIPLKSHRFDYTSSSIQAGYAGLALHRSPGPGQAHAWKALRRSNCQPCGLDQGLLFTCKVNSIHMKYTAYTIILYPTMIQILEVYLIDSENVSKANQSELVMSYR